MRKALMALAAIATLAVLAAAPAQAQRGWGPGLAAGVIGGAIVGGALAGPGYYYGPGYGYGYGGPPYGRAGYYGATAAARRAFLGSSRPRGPAGRGCWGTRPFCFYSSRPPRKN